MLRNKPRLAYVGLTVILSNPSRFDIANLLSATGGQLFNTHCLRPEFNTMQCDIRLADDKSPFLSGTKCIMTLGEYAAHHLIPETRKNSIGEIRGGLYFINGIPCIPSFLPQEAADLRAHEDALNPLSANYKPDATEYDSGDDEDEGDVKRHGKTKRANYAFWLREDCRKAKTILQSGIPHKEYPAPEYIIYPNSDEVIRVLTDTKNGFFYFDMETDYEAQNMQCFSFSFDGQRIYSVPILDYNYNCAYSAAPFILRALAIAIRDNIIVAHNGACFDFFVLGYKYKIAINKAYDTMIAHHRCWPDIEKSLGHSVSHLTWENFHKDEDSGDYRTREQMMARLKYCAKDVYTMFLVHKGIEKFSRTILGLPESIQTAMDSIRPYLITSLQGIRFDENKSLELMHENDKLMMQYSRMIKLLIGEETLAQLKRRISGKAKSFAGSQKQCINYFHEMLGYPVIARSKKTGAPSLGKKALFTLALKHDNPIIQLVLAYRAVQKEFGTLNIVPWIDAEGKYGTKTIIEYETDKATASAFLQPEQKKEQMGQTNLSLTTY